MQQTTLSESVDFTTICRACLCHKSEMQSLFVFRLVAKLVSVTNVQVAPGDGLPETVCDQCMLQIYRSFEFKQMCEESDSKLRQIYLRKQTGKAIATATAADAAANGDTSENRDHVDDESMITNRSLPTDTQSLPGVEYVLSNGTVAESQFLQVIKEESKSLMDTEDTENTIIPDELYPSVTLMNPSYPLHASAPISTIRNMFNCSKCKKRFGEARKLQHHVKEHCRTRADLIAVRGLSPVNEIITTISQNPMVSPNNIDPLLTPELSSESHTSTTNKEIAKHECPYCPNFFYKACALTIHMRTHTEDKRFVCSICEMQLADTRSLEIHTKAHATGNQTFECSLCKGKVFSQRFNLELHMRSHTGDAPHECKLCHKRFSQYCNMVRHMRCHNHNSVKPFVCEFCHRSYAEQDVLDRHKIIMHTDKLRFDCRACSRKFSQQHELDVHALVHTQRTSFECSICQQRFAKANEMVAHMKIHHTVDRPFVCKVCHKRFALEKTLKAHRLRFHNANRPHVCTICKMGFSKITKLIAHMELLHVAAQKRFICKFCQMEFETAHNLINHMHVHTGQKDFVCDICGNRYADKIKLTQHMEKHRRPRPFVCDICETSFKFKVNLDKHKEKNAC